MAFDIVPFKATGAPTLPAAKRHHVHHVNGSPVPEVWFHAVNFSDSALQLSLVAIPEFRLTDANGNGIQIERQIQNVEIGRTIAARSSSLVRVTKDLTETQIERLCSLLPAWLHNATVSISVQGFRDNEPFPYVVSGVGMNGTVDLPSRPPPMR